MYRINGKKVTKEEFFAKKGTPIQAGDRLTVIGANSFDGFVSPVDGSYIDNHAKLKEHNRKNDVVQVGDDLLDKGCHGRTRKESIEHQIKGQNDDTGITNTN